MTIEKRTSHRIAVKMPAILRWRDGEIGGASIENVSLDGMMIHADGKFLHRNAILEVLFTFDGGEWRLPVLVVHTHGKRHGVMFAASQYELYGLALHRMLPGQVHAQESPRQPHSLAVA